MKKLKFRVWNGEKWTYLEGIYNCPQPEYEGKDYQFTGLLDKRGTPIYEGDIVETSLEEIALVEYCGNAFDFTHPTENLLIYGENPFDCCEIIGNIHENPELLEK